MPVTRNSENLRSVLSMPATPEPPFLIHMRPVSVFEFYKYFLFTILKYPTLFGKQSSFSLSKLTFCMAIFNQPHYIQKHFQLLLVVELLSKLICGYKYISCSLTSPGDLGTNDWNSHFSWFGKPTALESLLQILVRAQVLLT